MKGDDFLSSKTTMNVFDYIVIGAGTAGGIIAEKLSDDHRTSVLVLEAGTNMTEQFSNPNLLLRLVIPQITSFLSMSQLE